VLILGGGLTGLTAAIYAAREGMDALVSDRSALGGQAGLTERIDNYPGFPDGVGGAALAALMEAKARRYGVELLSAVGVQQFCREGDEVLATTTAGDRCRGGATLIAACNSHRRLGVLGRGLSGSRQSGHRPGRIGGSCVRGAGSRSSDRAPRLAFGWPRACPSFPGSDR
jgi:thioredoxin reductase (NADPH)